MALAIRLLCMLSVASGFNAVYACSAKHQSKSVTSIADKGFERPNEIVQEGQSAIGRDTDALLRSNVAKAIAEINAMTVSKELAYWVKIVDAHEKLDVTELIRLQNNERPQNNLRIQIKTILFIISAINQQHMKSQDKITQKEESAVALTPMAFIKKGSFFKQITTEENTASN